MKKATVFTLAALLLLSLTACGVKTKETYLTTSFTQEIMNGATYKTEYVYDKEWRTSEMISYQDGEKSSRQSYEYTENGMIITMTGGGENATMEVVNTKDENGNIVKSVQYMDGELYTTNEITYHENGSRQTLTVTQASTGQTIQYEYDEKGNLSAWNSNNAGDISGSRTDTEYDENGNILTVINYNLDGTLSSRSESTRGEDGTETILSYDSDETLTGKQIITYDDAGNKTCSESYDQSGELLIRLTYTYVKADIPVE